MLPFLIRGLRFCLSPLVAFLFLSPLAVIGQQPSPSPSPQRTGKSYSSETPNKKPPPPAPQAQSPITFSDITTSTNINFRRTPSFTSGKYLLEAVGGGVGRLDYENEGRLDLVFTNRAAFKGPMPKRERPCKHGPEYWNRLYHPTPHCTLVDG